MPDTEADAPMATCRIYQPDSPPKILELATDDELLEAARQYLEGKTVEVWRGSELVARFPDCMNLLPANTPAPELSSEAEILRCEGKAADYRRLAENATSERRVIYLDLAQSYERLALSVSSRRTR